MATRHALVQFRDGKRRVKYLVLTKDIEGYSPASAQDIPNREFLVKWQDSFHNDDDDIHHDGRYPARVLIVGATIDEIRAKAAELKIKMPAQIPLPANDEEQPQALKKPLRKQRRKKEDVDAIEISKKQRMEETSALLSKEASIPFTGTPLKSKKALSKSSSQKQTNHATGSKSHFHSSETKSTGKAVSQFPRKTVREEAVEAWTETSEFGCPRTVPLASEASPTTTIEAGSDSDDESGSLQHSQEYLSTKLKTVLSQNCDSQQPFKITPPIHSQAIKAKRKRTVIDSSHSEAETDDEDDATVLLDQLKKEHSLCINKINKLQQELKSTKKENAQLKFSEERLLKEIKEYQQKTKSGYNDEPRDSSLSFLSENDTDAQFSSMKVSSPFSFAGQSSPSHSTTSPLLSASSHQKSKHLSSGEPIKKSVSRNLFSNDDSNALGQKLKSNINDVDEFGAGLEGVAKRIEADLKGETRLQGDEKRVNVGMGFKVNRSTWEKGLRLKKDDSKFFKDCAGLIWGRESLKERTGNRSTANKKPCTPKKVALLHAMLKGKMSARGESAKQQDSILSNLAPKWLTDKCYDSGRPPKTSKKTPDD